MHQFSPTFSDVRKDIDRYEQRVLDAGNSYQRNLKAQRYILDRYYERQSYDALVVYFSSWNWEAGNGPFLIELSDALERRRDVRRLKLIWSSVIAKQKMNFWQTQAILKGDIKVGGLKELVLSTLATVRDIMVRLGEAKEVARLNDEMERIQEEKRGKRLPRAITRAMDQTCFWELIEKAGANAASCAERMERLTDELELFKAAEIKKFDKLLRERMAQLYHWDLWALAYLAQGGCSDDAFEYFRCWLILQGERICKLGPEKVLKLAAHVPPGQETLAEGLMSVPAVAYENRDGKPLKPSNGKLLKLQGNPWDEAELKARYPALYEHYSRG